VSGLYSYLVLCGDVAANPVPRGLATRRRGSRGVALVRTPHTLPKILTPAEVDALMAALRHWRDRAMVEAMLLGGLRRCEVLGLRFEDLRPGEGRVFVADGKGDASYCTSLVLLMTIWIYLGAAGEADALVRDGWAVAGRFVEPLGPVAASVCG
jgi:integrase